MDTRLSAAYNIRAAQITMIPGGAAGIVMNVAEGGESRWEQYPAPKQKPVDTGMCIVPAMSDIAMLREKCVEKYVTQPWEKGTTYTKVLNADKLNQEYSRVTGANYPDENFDIIGSEKYPEPPVYWQMFPGANSRQFGRSDGIKYRR